jgi:glycine/D-amino acid oxidase-like deaminating enzyme
VPRSFWRDTAPPIRLDDPVPGARVEVAVVGAGLSGLTAAWSLAEAGRDVWVVDQAGVGGGASGHNGGIVAPGLADPYGEAVERLGRDTARTLLAMSWRTVDLLQDVARLVPFDIELELPGRVTLARDREELRRLETNAELLREDGQVVDLLGPEAVPTPLQGEFIGGIRLRGGFVHSGRLVSALATLSQTAGVRIVAPVAVERVEHRAGGWRLRAGSWFLDAEEVLLATNGWTRRLYPSLPIEPQRGQVIVTEPLPPVLAHAMSARAGFDYFHQRRDGRLVIGGFRDKDFAAEATDEMALNDRIQAELAALAARLAGHVPRIDWRWAGIMGFTPDHLPIVAELEEHLWVAAGYSGHGVVMAPLVGRLMAERIRGKDVPELRLFDPKRPTLTPPGR